MSYALDATAVAWSIISIFLLTRITEGIYNIFFHPLSKFPGPKAAALSEWFQTYHEVIRHHSMVDIFADLHSKYGEVVRVAPNEVCYPTSTQKALGLISSSYISQIRMPTTIYTIREIVGTRRRYSTRVLEKTGPHLDSRHIKKQSNVEISSQLHFLVEPFSILKVWFKAM